ncbi:hypothetical protein AVEN_269858-1 [Araneus ventricosus]|uniref:Uncharacterized protein n=1 Tax=Araneus ventricosus TaxID=182803 RepID=A0A4Y2CF13_ARAVE|nr:hypothetical protein AVEN_269858-1 [Araneus ventricosus]
MIAMATKAHHGSSRLPFVVIHALESDRAVGLPLYRLSIPKSKTLLLYPNKDTEEKNLVKLLKTEIKIGRDFQIEDVRMLKNDGIAVDGPSQQDIDKMLERIGKNPSL